MLVYGDRSDRADPRLHAREINARLTKIEALAPGLERHSTLVSAFIEAGRLWQGLADASFAAAKIDRRTAAAESVAEVVFDLARAVCRSWDSGFGRIGALPRLLSSPECPSEVGLRVPEGLAFYALYPEAFAEAARRLKLGGTARVIGIRSIGTSLAAIVAAALDTGPPLTVRPFGDPYDRRISVDPEMEHALLDGDPHFVIVDEGPGQSGSSFGAVADWLRERGVTLERIAVVPSHSGDPGPAASKERRQWWRTVQREVGDFGDRLPALLESWCAELLGPTDARLNDLSGGRWRELRYPRAEDWPPSITASERRKFLAVVDGEPLLLKFAGLGEIGEEKLRIAQQLAVDDFVPEPIALVHGFLAERWRGDTSPFLDEKPSISRVAVYIGSRAKLFPANPGSGASIAELLEMARRNISLELGDEAVHSLKPWEAQLAELDARVLRIRTDNRLQLHEWLRARDGVAIKADALDHHQAHDLVGCQDLAWDIAGAIVEFDLDQVQTEALIGFAEEAALRPIDRQLLAFYRLAYLAFQVGQFRLGAAMVDDRAEKERLKTRGDRHACELQLLLECSAAATRPDSSVGKRTERTGSGTSLPQIG